MLLTNFKQKLSWWGLFTLFNSVVALLIGLRYLSWFHVPDVQTGSYVALLYVGQFFFLSLLIAIVSFLFIFLPQKFFIFINTLLSTLALSILVIDTFVYDQFRFHISSFVIELILGAGGDVFQFSWVTWALVVGGAVVAFLLHLFAANWLWYKSLKLRYVALGFVFGFISLLSVHAWHAWADANHDTKITATSPHLPLYYGLTAKRYFVQQGWIDPQNLRKNDERLRLNSRNSGALEYPQNPLVCHEPEKKHNILLITIESLRSDMLKPKFMPNIYEFAKNKINFKNHYSNGNATKPGLFTLFYGIPASYWDAFTSSQTPPLWIKRMQELEYQTEILASATLLSPAFDRNVFSSIENLRMDTPGNSPWQKDIRITEDWINFTDKYVKNKNKSPFFGFLFYDTPHAIYLPNDYPKFQPYWENVNYLELNNDFDPEPYFNVYRSTVHYADHLVKKVLDDLEKKNLLENTIVMITSDHGKEFNDNKKNFWGHGSNFSDYQLKVPMIVHWPGEKSQQIEYKTSHFDVAPTFISKALGCEQTPAKDYATGYGLFNSQQHDWSIAHSYVHYALLYKDLLVVRSPVGPVQVTTKSLKPVESYQIPSVVVKEVLLELSRFFK